MKTKYINLVMKCKVEEKDDQNYEILLPKFDGGQRLKLTFPMGEEKNDTPPSPTISKKRRRKTKK